jgi:hypothetical protein
VLALEDQVRSLRADLASSRAKHERSERVVGRMEAEALAMRLVICEVRDVSVAPRPMHPSPFASQFPFFGPNPWEFSLDVLCY